MKHIKISCQKHKIGNLYCHPGACQTTWKLVQFYMLISLKQKKWLKIYLKKLMMKNSFIELSYVVGAHWNCLNEAIPMCTNIICYWNLGNLFEIYIYQESCPSSLRHLNISNCQSVLKNLLLNGKLFIVPVLESFPKCLHKSPCTYWILKNDLII